jgi:hypothetical protein
MEAVFVTILPVLTEGGAHQPADQRTCCPLLFQGLDEKLAGNVFLLIHEFLVTNELLETDEILFFPPKVSAAKALAGALVRRLKGSGSGRLHYK